MSEIGLYLKERFEEIVDPIDVDAFVAELEEDERAVTSLSPPRLPERRKAWLGAAVAAAVTIVAVGGTLLLLPTGGSGNGVADTEPLPTISDTRAVDIYGAVTESIVSGEITARAECDRYRDLPEEGPSNTTPRQECPPTLVDPSIVYIVDHPVEFVTSLEADCSGPDPFDEQPEICDQALTVVHTAPFGSDVKDAIQRVFPDPSVVEFVESEESVTEEINELPHPLGRGRRIVANDGALLRLGPIFTDGSVFYLGVRCDGCQSAGSWFFRAEETVSGWVVES